jgi:hypothetical protein
MQKFLFTLILALVCTFSFGQDVANFGTKTAITTGKTTGTFEVKMPARVTAEDVANYSQYYESFFTVVYNANTKMATIKMINNDSPTRRIIIRFLASNQIQNVTVDNVSYDLNSFYDNFLK